MKIFYSILLILLSFSCKEKITPAEQIRQLNQSDTFYYEDNRPEWISDSEYTKGKLKFANYNKLESIETGFDSIQIRINYGGPMTGYRLVILKNEENKWNALASKDIHDVKPGLEDSVKMDYWDRHTERRIFESKTPRSGWGKFIKELFKYNILTLTSENKIQGFVMKSVNDGVGVDLELATKKVYRSYYFNNPNFYLDKYKEIRNISQILKLIDEEFELEKLWDYMNEIPSEPSGPIKIQEIELKDVKVDSVKH